MLTHRRPLQVLSLVVLLSLLFSGMSPALVPPASAQGGDGLERQVNAQTGKVSFISPAEGRTISASRVLGASLLPSDSALALAQRFAPEFGIKDPQAELAEMKVSSTEDGRITTRFQQSYRGVPVLGGELIVNTDTQGNLYSLNGEAAADLSLSTQPAVDAAQARQIALESMAKWYEKAAGDFTATEPELWIYDESLLLDSTRPAELVWRMDVTPNETSMPVRELVLVNAQRGGVSLHFNQVDTFWAAADRPALGDSGAPERSGGQAPALAFSPVVSTYTANHGSTLPGSLVCTQANPTCAGGDAHAQAAHKYAIGTFHLYANQHNRNSINGAGMKITSTVRYKSGYENAFWSGTQMVYGDAYGYPLADDVVAHELTHGVTQYESNLFYYYQAGAINESFSDIWGEYYDQSNGQGTDTAGVKWLMGEDVSGMGALRSLSDPTVFYDPDSLLSYLYETGETDNGGVHSNSGVNNKAAYLMVQGGAFNGRTVSTLGWTKTAAIYYEVQSKLLSSGADYADLYYALPKACSNLIGQKGITAADCVEVKDAVDAVEMSGQPGGNYNVEAPVCNGGTVPNLVFTDNLEAGTGNWTFSNGAYKRWQLDTPIGPFAQSGLHSLFADDYPDRVTDAIAKLKNLTIPANAYLHFAHAFGFEGDYSFYDGGVLEYSINNGATWTDANALITHNGYRGQIAGGFGNPLSGRNGFVGDSHGYISSRLNLASLAGKSVSFRWRMGLDSFGYDWGWWVDSVKLYTCPPPPGAFGKINPAYGAYTASMTPTISWAASSGATSYQYCYDTTDDGACSNWISNGTATSKVLSGLSPSTTYYWQVRAHNNYGATYADGGATAFWPFGTLYPPDQFWKESPSLGASGQSLSPTLTWSASNGATSYQYCYDTIDDDQCNRTWGYAPLNSITISNLGPGTTYYWQVRAVNAAGVTAADNEMWHNFTTTSTLPPGTTGVNTWIGTTQQGRYSLASGQSLRESYLGVSNGPVAIESTNALFPLIAAERVVYKVNNVPASYTEMMGLPDNQLDTTYWLPWYNNVELDTQLRFANVTNSTATVRVFVGQAEMAGSPYTLAPGESTRKSFAGVNGGPVKIESDVPIVAAERVVYKVNNANTSFTEMMALPNSQLDTIYYLPWYNNVELDTQLRFANVSDTPASVHIYIGDDEMSGSPYTLAPGESTRKSYPGINNGPVKIVSDVPIVAAERVVYKVNNVNTSFTEMMGLPANQLDTTYWLPWYNNVELDTQLRFANVSDTPASVHIYIGGEEMIGSPFTLLAGESTRKSFAGINDGPVQIVSDAPIVAAARVVFKVSGVGTSFIEMMGLPDSLLDTTYWLPWYNNVELDTQLRFGRP